MIAFLVSGKEQKRKDYLKFAIHNIKGWPSNELVATFQMKQKRLQQSSISGQEIQRFGRI